MELGMRKEAPERRKNWKQGDKRRGGTDRNGRLKRVLCRSTVTRKKRWEEEDELFYGKEDMTIIWENQEKGSAFRRELGEALI